MIFLSLLSLVQEAGLVMGSDFRSMGNNGSK
jgi:hypothetical protein